MALKKLVRTKLAAEACGVCRRTFLESARALDIMPFKSVRNGSGTLFL